MASRSSIGGPLASPTCNTGSPASLVKCMLFALDSHCSHLLVHSAHLLVHTSFPLPEMHLLFSFTWSLLTSVSRLSSNTASSGKPSRTPWVVSQLSGVVATTCRAVLKMKCNGEDNVPTRRAWHEGTQCFLSSSFLATPLKGRNLKSRA